MALLAFEVSGKRPWAVVLIQVLLIGGIVVTSALDMRDIRRRQARTPDPLSS